MVALEKITLRQLFARFGISRVHGIVLGADFVVESLVAGAAFAIGTVRCLAIKFEHQTQLGERAAYVAFLPGIQRSLVDLFFVLTELFVVPFLTVDLSQQLQGARLFRPQLQDILRRASRKACG